MSGGSRMKYKTSEILLTQDNSEMKLFSKKVLEDMK